MLRPFCGFADKRGCCSQEIKVVFKPELHGVMKCLTKWIKSWSWESLFWLLQGRGKSPRRKTQQADSDNWSSTSKPIENIL